MRYFKRYTRERSVFFLRVYMLELIFRKVVVVLLFLWHSSSSSLSSLMMVIINFFFFLKRSKRDRYYYNISYDCSRWRIWQTIQHSIFFFFFFVQVKETKRVAVQRKKYFLIKCPSNSFNKWMVEKLMNELYLSISIAKTYTHVDFVGSWALVFFLLYLFF